MSVYTQVSSSMLETLLQQYSQGKLVSFRGIGAGTDNTNYFVTTENGQFVLTIFENLPDYELPFFMELGEHLHTRGCRVARPIPDASGQVIQRIAGKSGVLFERLQGNHIPVPSLNQCFAIGRALAEVHLAVADFNGQREHAQGLSWLQDFDQALLTPEQQELYLHCLKTIEQLDTNLPKGVIHADLFHDNALFDGESLAGIIDWYFAGEDYFVLDIATTINDWCRHGVSFNYQKVKTLLAGYESRRPLSDEETSAIPIFQIQSALRFWLSRTYIKKQLEGTDQSNVTVKPPAEMEQLVRLLSAVI